MNDTLYKQEMSNLINEYGINTIPRDKWFTLSETLRASYILASNKDANPATILRHYGIPTTVIATILGDTDDCNAPQRKQKRADKYQTIIDWCYDHALEQVSVNQIAEVGQVTYPTALKFINDRVDLFRKVKRGVYEVRDAKAERAEKKK